MRDEGDVVSSAAGLKLLLLAEISKPGLIGGRLERNISV
jgi:hypothetical protein